MVAHDWHGIFQKHVYEVAPEPPTGELARTGWRLIYTRKPNRFIEAFAAVRGFNDQWWISYGLMLNKDDAVTDVREGSPAWDARMAPGMKIVAVGGQAFAASPIPTRMRAKPMPRGPRGNSCRPLDGCSAG